MYYYLIYLAIMSVIAFIEYGIDKSKAESHQWRIKESVLLSLGFFGGALGAFLGMKIFRHKTKHWYFYVVNYLGFAWQVIIVVLINRA